MRLISFIIMGLLYGQVAGAQTAPYRHQDTVYGTCWRNDHIRICAVPQARLEMVMPIEDSLSGPFYSPVCQSKVISRYGARGRSNHSGTDLKQKPTDTIYATQNGVVRMSCSYSGYGKVIVIRHPNGLETVYSHLNALWVQANDTVLGCQPIGIAGRTGRATTEHLHFEFRFLYNTFDAERVYDFEQQRLKCDTLYFKAGVLQGPKSGSRREMLAGDSKPEASASAEGCIHIIKKGETLYSLARQYGTSVADLCQRNGIKDPSKICVGQRLVVFEQEPETGTSYDDVI